MGNLNGGQNPYENLTKSSFKNLPVLSQQEENLDLSQPIYRVVTWDYTNHRWDIVEVQAIVDTRYLFKPSKFWNISQHLGLVENTFVNNVEYWDQVSAEEFLLDQSLQHKKKVAEILMWDNKTIH